jgi:glycosyltransferase involved in cell wall biosynthesis
LGFTGQLPTASITVCVPVGTNHIHLLPRLLRNLDKSDHRPDQVLIAPSAATNSSAEARSHSLSVRTLEVESGATASRNRNRAWDQADTDYVTFCDVDDWYAPWRLRFLLEAMDKYSAHVAYHSYKYLSSPWFLRSPKRFPLVAEPDVLQRLNYGSTIHPEQTHLGGNNPVFPSLSGSSRAHLGHVTVRRTSDVRFPSIPYGEDGWFASEALRRNLRVIYLGAPLSIYDPLSFRNLRLAATSRGKHWMRRSVERLTRTTTA